MRDYRVAKVGRANGAEAEVPQPQVIDGRHARRSDRDLTSVVGGPAGKNLDEFTVHWRGLRQRTNVMALFGPGDTALLSTLPAECRRLDPGLDAIVAWLEALGEPVVAVEATLYWHWLERQLTARGFGVGVAHPYQVKLSWQAPTKIDPIDTRKLAELARVNLLPAIWIPDLATRALRQLLRGRVFLVRQRTVIWNARRRSPALTSSARFCMIPPSRTPSVIPTPTLLVCAHWSCF